MAVGVGVATPGVPPPADRHGEAGNVGACTNGLNVDGLVSFSNPRLITIETDGDPTFQDYLGLTGDITP